MPNGMAPEAYAACQELLIAQARMVQLLPLVDFLEAIDRAETLGPVIDPTLWTKSHKQLESIKRIAQGAGAFQRAIESEKQLLLGEGLVNA